MFHLFGAILLAQAESDVGSDGARRSPILRPSRPTQQPARFSQPEGPGISPLGSEAIVSDVHWGMPFDNRLCPDENLLRQNGSK